MYWHGVVCRYSNERLTSLIVFYFRYFAGYDMTHYFVYVYVAGWCHETPWLIGATDVLKESTLTIKLKGKVTMAETATNPSSVLPAWWPLCAWRKISQAGYQEFDFHWSQSAGLAGLRLATAGWRLSHLLEAMQAFLSAHCEIYWKLLVVIFFRFFLCITFWLNNSIRYSVYALLFFNEPSIQMRIYGLAIVNIRKGCQRKTLRFSIR